MPIKRGCYWGLLAFAVPVSRASLLGSNGEQPWPQTQEGWLVGKA